MNLEPVTQSEISQEENILDVKTASLVAQTVKNPPVMRETWGGKIRWRRGWQPTPVFWPGEFHGHTSLAGDSPWRCRVHVAECTHLTSLHGI